MKWINVNEKYLNFLRAVEGRIPHTDYGSDKYKPFFGTKAVLMSSESTPGTLSYRMSSASKFPSRTRLLY